VYRRNERADADRMSQVLAGLVFPAAKWQLLMHAEDYGADACTRADLWALPVGEYADLGAVLATVQGTALPDRLPDGAGPASRPPAREPLLPRAPMPRIPGSRHRPTPQVVGRLRPLH
jgi:hypothetical protein